MTNPLDANDASPIPGLDTVGHGLYLRPHAPYELRGVLFPRNNHRLLSFRDTEVAYSVPEGYDVDDSPPMPANQLLNQVKIEESWDRFNKQLQLDTTLAVGGGVFSISPSASNASQMRSDHEAYYAVRSSFIPLWAVYLSDTTNYLPDLDSYDIPVPFRYAHRAAYEAFFQRFGSHYVKRAWIGGKAMLFFTILKSSQLSKQDIQAGIKASYTAASAGPSLQQNQSREKLQKSSECSVSGKGGNEIKLASLSSLDETHYNEWLATIHDNPQTIELEVAGIWTLLKDPDKAQALADAYKAANVFSYLSAAFSIDKTVVLMRGRKYFTFDMERAESEKPRLISDRWPVLAENGFERIDAAFTGSSLQFANGEDSRRHVHFFYRDNYARVDVDTGKLVGSPVAISKAWPGLPFGRIDAAFATGRDTVYFFSGSQYVRFNTLKNAVDPGYPQLFSKRWKGVTFDRIDTAVYWANGKIYFFREDQYIRYDMSTFQADPGYPKAILGDYVEDWKFFD